MGKGRGARREGGKRGVVGGGVGEAVGVGWGEAVGVRWGGAVGWGKGWGEERELEKSKFVTTQCKNGPLL